LNGRVSILRARAANDPPHPMTPPPPLPTLRAGLHGDAPPSKAEADTTDTVLALLRLFMKEAIVVSGRCAIARGRRCVSGADMRGALMYCARTFFERDAADMERRLHDEAEAMRREEEEGEESGEEEEGEESGEEEGSGEESGASEGSGEGGEAPPSPPSPRDVALARHVEAIVQSWPLWRPTDPVHQMIKRAIDGTPL
jgi:hypothetical protein